MHKTKREIQEALAAWFPKPDAKTVLRKLPEAAKDCRADAAPDLFAVRAPAGLMQGASKAAQVVPEAVDVESAGSLSPATAQVVPAAVDAGESAGPLAWSAVVRSRRPRSCSELAKELGRQQLLPAIAAVGAAAGAPPGLLG